MQPAPDQESSDAAQQHQREHAVDRRRQMIDHADRGRLIQQAEAERGHVAEPEGEPGEEADVGDAHRADAVSGINAVADHGRDQRYRADAMRDRIAGEARQRRDPVRHVLAAHGVQREPVIQRDAAIGRGDQHQRECDGREVGGTNDVEDLVVIDIPERVSQSEYRGGADHNADQGAAEAFDTAASAQLLLQGRNTQSAGPICLGWASRSADRFVARPK